MDMLMRPLVFCAKEERTSMHTKHSIVPGLKHQILTTPNYSALADFPGSVLRLETFDALVNWLGTFDSGALHLELHAVVELVRVANTVDQGTNLQKFCQWALLQPIGESPYERLLDGKFELVTGDQFAHFIKESVQAIEQAVSQSLLQQAFELTAILAMRMADQNPAFRPALAKWVISLYDA
jgi:hypothetical protein